MKFSLYTLIAFIVLLGSLLQFSLMAKGLQAMVAPLNVEAAQLTEEQDNKPKKISIAKINLNLPVVSVPLENGTWQVNEGVANYAEGTSLVNSQGGNVGIFAHDRENGFLKVKELKKGDEIVIEGDNFQATYAVDTISIISPTEIGVFYATRAPQLTLITCEGVLSEKRYMVKASLKELRK